MAFCELRLKQALATPQIAGAANVGQSKAEAGGAFVADGAEVVLAILHAQAAAVPVIAGLHSNVLGAAKLQIDA